MSTFVYFIGALSTLVSMVLFMDKVKNRDYLLVLLIGLLIWVNTLASYTFNKWIWTFVNYFETGELTVIANGTAAGSAYKGALSFVTCGLILVVSYLGLIVFILVRDKSIYIHSKMPTTVLVIGDTLSLFVGLVSMYSNLVLQYNRVEAMRTVHGYLIAVGYIIVSYIVISYYTGISKEQRSKTESCDKHVSKIAPTYGEPGYVNKSVGLAYRDDN